MITKYTVKCCLDKKRQHFVHVIFSSGFGLYGANKPHHEDDNIEIHGWTFEPHDIDPDAQTYERSPAPAKPAQKSTPKPADETKPKRAELGSMAKKPAQNADSKPTGVVSEPQLKLMRDLISQVDGDEELLHDLCGGQPEHLSMADAKAVINDLLMLKRGAGALLFDDAGKAYVQKENE